MTCTRCEGTGFLNIDQVPQSMMDGGDSESIRLWIKNNPETDACVCDCCGDGEEWYGMPGEHFSGGDYRGPTGPYAYNGGLPECN